MIMKKIFNFFAHRKNSTNTSKESEIVFFDPFIGEKFKATRFEVVEAFSEINRELKERQKGILPNPEPICLNELYSKIPKATKIYKKSNRFNNRFGWIETDFPVDFSLHIELDQESSHPIMVLKYNVHDFEAELPY